MKVSLNWIKQYTEVNLATDELVELAVSRLGGVEGYDNLADRYQDVLVASVVSCEPHPNADKLQLCLIDDGYTHDSVERNEEDMIQVVCGAPNVAEGQLVAWIPPGATVPSSAGTDEPFVLDSRELRGEISHGMIASPKELGLSDEHDGILVVDEEDAEVGQSFASLYELDDTVIDIENKMFTHRPDGFGQLGVAREIAGIQHNSFSSPDWYREEVDLPQSGESEVIKKLKIDVDEPGLCRRITAVTLDNIEIKSSPAWLQSRLARVGITPRNNVVDITNYIMMLTAQPIHAFDFDKIATDKGAAEITVRKPKSGESLELINGNKVEPHEDALLIANHKGPIALAGVMGGAESEISADTTRIVIECANFDMYNNRRTSMIHGLFTDAVTRFSKGQSPKQLRPVLKKTIELLQELAGAQVVGEVVDVNNTADENNPTVELTGEFVNQYLGTELSVNEMQNLLENVEMTVELKENTLKVVAPFWRTDIEIKEDVVEEIGRLYGFDRLPRSLPSRMMSPVSSSPLAQTKQALTDSLRRAGANELKTHSFVNRDLIEQVGQDPEQTFKITNALSRELQHYRLTPLPSLLTKVHSNIKAGYEKFALFELAATHNRKFHKDDDDGLPKEIQFLDIVYASRNPQSGAAFYQMRSLVDAVLGDLIDSQLVYKAIEKEQDYPPAAPFDHKRSALVETVSGEFVGMVGELKSSVIDSFKLPKYCAAATLDVESISSLYHSQTSSYQPLPKFPSITQDITLRSESTLSYQQLFMQLQNALQQQLEDSQSAQFELIDIFQAEDDDPRQTSWRVTLVDQNTTLEADKVNQLLDQAASQLDIAERV